MIICWMEHQFFGILAFFGMHCFLCMGFYSMPCAIVGAADFGLERSQDPRLEAAKPKGRGTSDASEKALEVRVVSG